MAATEQNCTRDLDCLLVPHYVCKTSSGVRLKDVTTSVAMLNSGDRIEDEKLQLTGQCTHKDFYLPLKIEFLGYAIIFLIVFKLYFNEVINEGFIILTMFLFFEFNHMQSVGYMN
jgi:hypothetical protein